MVGWKQGHIQETSNLEVKISTVQSLGSGEDEKGMGKRRRTKATRRDKTRREAEEPQVRKGLTNEEPPTRETTGSGANTNKKG